MRVRVAPLLTAAALAASVPVVGGCGLVGSAGDGRTSDTDFAEPAEEASDELGPLIEPPRDSREVGGDGYVL